MSDDDILTREQWRTVLDDTDHPTFGELVRTIQENDMVDGDPEALVEQATGEAGSLTVDAEASGMFDVYQLGEEFTDTAESTNDLNLHSATEDRDVLVNNGDDHVDAEQPTEEAAPEDETPGCETAKPASGMGETTETGERARSAFGDAVEYFHNQLDTDLSAIDTVEYDTPRDAFQEGRGWTDETITTKRLGWAPANDTGLLDHLMRKGYGREAILGTGLFWPNGLEPIWKGRFVLPYFDAEGRPAFAISRRAGNGHPADRAGDYGDGPAKYHKLPVSAIDECTREEPIYGRDTVEPGEDVLITEGIADAITAHQAGYACLSPVTTSFKISDRERLAELLEAEDVGRVYIVNDAEPPTSSLRDAEDAEGWDRLHVEQYGEGVRGAVRTASYLAEQGINARIGELPQPAAEKVDLDDYLTRWGGDLRPILATSRKVEDHPAYDPRDAALEAADASRGWDGPTTSATGSALFDLGIRDVTGLGWDYRGENPLGHHGNSENYFVQIRDHGLAYDFKYKKAYNALTYLLVEAGERDAASPNGRLDDGEVFTAWQQAKGEGLLPEEDPIPRRALRYVAQQVTDWDGDLVEHETRDGDTFDGLPADVYNATLEAIREDYGIAPGRTPSGAVDEDAEPRALLPPAVRDLTAATTGWDWRHTAEQSDEDLSVDEARNRTTEAIADAYGTGDRVLIEALPTMGKSYGSIKAAAETGEAITVLTGRGHKEQYDQFKQVCDEFGLSYYQLPSFKRDCETANGEHGGEWSDTVDGWYHRGATPQQIHKAAEDVLGERLPCQQDGHTCSYTAKWDFNPDEYDVLIGHYSHAYRGDKVVNGRSVVLDEFPNAYETTLGPELQGAVSYWLDTTPGIPFDSYTDLVEHRSDADRRGEALAWFDEVGVDADEGHVFDDRKAHAAAPLVVYTLLAGEDLGNGFEAADLGDVGLGAFDRDGGEVSVLRPPDFTYASAVIGLDGTPTKQMWELSLGERLNHRRVLQGAERTEYIQEALNLNIVRTTEYVKPYNSADHVNTDADAALLEAIREQHGERPGLITSSTAETEYREAGVLDLVADTKHYGNVLGSNQFKSKRVGAVIGSNHYGDDYLKKWGAYAGEAVERNDEKGSGLSYGGFGDRILTHMREHGTLQAAMRFGRDAAGAVVYVHTDTLPDWVPTAGEGRVVRTYSDGEREVIDAAEDLNSWRTKDLVEEVSVGERQVFNILTRLVERGVVSREYDGRGYTWESDGLHEVGDHGEVELTPVDLGTDEEENDTDAEAVQEIARSSIYTWEFRNSATNPEGPTDEDASTPAATGNTVGSGGSTPPDPAD